MKEKLSFRHMLRLMRYFWRTEKHLYKRLFLGLVAFYVFKSMLFWLAGRFFSLEYTRGLYVFFNDEWVFWGFILISAAYMFASLGRKQTATTTLVLPASNLEKYLSRVVYATLGIWLLAFAARVTAHVITSIPMLIDTLFLGGEVSLRQIVFGYILPGQWVLFSSYWGTTPLLGFLRYVFLSGTMALWPWSVFTLSGLLFCRNGWLWAIPTLFVGVGIAYFVFEKLISKTWAWEHDTLLMLLFVAVIYLFSAFNYWLGYRCFCRAQVVTCKSMRL